MKVLFLTLILCLIIPATAYSQIAGLDNASTPTRTQTPLSTQCLDFNQDGICESIVLVNGTIIKNPELPVNVPTLNNNTNSNSTVAKPLNSTATGPCSGGVEYRLGAEIFCTPDEYAEAQKIQYEQEQEERERECEENPMCQAMQTGENQNEPWNDPGEGESNDNDNERDDEDRSETSEEFRESQEDKGVGCQPEDDYCDYDENCDWTSVDCIDDRGFDEDDYDG